MIEATRLALSWMTVLPVGRPGVPGSTIAGRAMTALPVVGLVCGLAATAAAHGAHALGAGVMLSGVVGVAVVTALTRAMHVDALADTADGLGSYADPGRALEIMRSGSVGPMGVAVVVLSLLAQVAALGSLVSAGAWTAPVAAFILSRSLPVVQLRRGVPAARQTGFGAVVAGSQSRLTVVSVGMLAAAAGAALAVSTTGVDNWWTPALGAVAGLAVYAAAGAFTRHTVHRFGGISGDVLGATIEVGATAALMLAVALV